MSSIHAPASYLECGKFNVVDTNRAARNVFSVGDMRNHAKQTVGILIWILKGHWLEGDI